MTPNYRIDENTTRHLTPRNVPAARWASMQTASYDDMQRGLALSLVPYVSGDDAELTREQFLRMVMTRIADDLHYGTF